MFSFVGNLKLIIMEAKELRIGNWLYNEYTKQYFQVYPMFIHQLSKSNDKNFISVPLTEEILLKCPQFKHNPIVKVATVFNMDLGRGRELTVSCVGTPNLAIFITNKENGKTTDIVTIWNYDYDKELYLHTFQNLIHSLTNEELTVNL